MSASSALIVIDGSHGEGGGALIRAAMGMAAITQQPFKLNNVRQGTKFPGLDAEDITLIKVLAESCGAEVQGVERGSEYFSFLPTRRPRGLSKKIEADRNESMRGPNALILLTALIPVFTRSGSYCSLIAEGETFGTHALSYDAFSNVTLPAFRKFGVHAFPDLLRAGFGRDSNGEVGLDIEPSAVNGIQWMTRGTLKTVGAVVTTCGLPGLVGERGISHLKKLAQSANLPLVVDRRDVEGRGPGAYVTIWAEYENGLGSGAAMGSRGIRIENLAQMAFEECYEWMASDATIDPYLADQILLLAVLAETPSFFKVSRLTKQFLTAVWVVKQFTPIHITVIGSENGPGEVTVKR